MKSPICHSVGAPGARTSAQNGSARLKIPRSLHNALRRPETMKTRPGYASLTACSLGGRPIDRNRTPPNWRRCLPRSCSYKFAFLRDCTLEAMRTQRPSEEQLWDFSGRCKKLVVEIALRICPQI